MNAVQTDPVDVQGVRLLELKLEWSWPYTVIYVVSPSPVL